MGSARSDGGDKCDLGNGAGLEDIAVRSCLPAVLLTGIHRKEVGHTHSGLMMCICIPMF